VYADIGTRGSCVIAGVCGRAGFVYSTCSDCDGISSVISCEIAPVCRAWFSDRRRTTHAPHARDGSCERWLGNVGRVTGGLSRTEPIAREAQKRTVTYGRHPIWSG